MTTTDVFIGLRHGLIYSRHHLVHSYIIIPIGLLILFTILYGLNQLLTNVFKIKFPASVLGMLINLVVLCVLNVLANIKHKPEDVHRKRLRLVCSWLLTNYLMVIKPSMNFSLKWINVFFIPSFIILPLSDAITFIECLKIAGVFVVGGLLLLCVDVYMILGLKWLLARYGKSGDAETEKKKSVDAEEIELQSMETNRHPWNDDAGVFTTMRDDITTIDIHSLRSNRTEPPPARVRSLSISDNPFNTQESSLRQPEPLHVRGGNLYKANTSPGIVASSASVSSGNSSSSSPKSVTPAPIENLSETSKKVVLFVTQYIDWVLYTVLFVVSLPLYYVRSIHVFLPYHLSITIIAYYLVLLIPIKWPQLKKFAHPILILTAEILFVCFIGSMIYHRQPKGFLEDLRYYKTGKTYLNLFSGKALMDNGETNSNTVNPTATPEWPGCGDFLSSLMDISIVSLSLPMFTHRNDFIKNFWVLVPPILVSIGLTFFIYPIFCYHIGIESARSIGFIGRLVTLALGTPLINALGGSISLMAVCTILSGICGVLVGDSIFNLLRIPSNDFVTRGVTLGINCGAIATAHLLNVDPRAASMSSLSFSVFGTVMVIMASIGAVRELIQSWVGM